MTKPLFTRCGTADRRSRRGAACACGVTLAAILAYTGNSSFAEERPSSVPAGRPATTSTPVAAAPAGAPAAPSTPTLDLEKLLRASAGKHPAAATEAEAEVKPAKAAARSDVEITSDNMDMDFGAKVSTFTGNVVVTEVRMKLRAEKMVVFFGQDDKPERIEASGNVIIEQPDEDRVARAGRAEYDVLKGMIILTEKPTLTMGNDTLTGATRIVYYRDNSRVTCDSGSADARPRITFTPKSQDVLPDLLKPTGKDGN